ncbi:MAG: peptide ABC transporter substrate-binding protein [Pyrinomonadaceae bacterium]|nr:peptide ABC transporter substrate-binding protein [Pyrinomonadaceae bacterium]MDQ3586459.1 peptide ABC transporter substrate-binding protein [Acidobacteriota bacterium]
MNFRMRLKEFPILKLSRWPRWRARLAVLLAVSLVVGSGGCFTEENGELFYGRVVTPRAQEFRWSDGGLPRVFDPALAAAPPDTDAVRALYEGLTEYDPRTLAPVSGVAQSWQPSADGREWTFQLRRDARWSNGEVVTAQDFVRSWQRITQLGDRAPHAKLLDNILGARQETPVAVATPSPTPIETPNAELAGATSSTASDDAPQPTPTPLAPGELFGAEAIDAHTLLVRLRRPDGNFPALVAHPIFRPVHQSQIETNVAGSEAVKESPPSGELAADKPGMVVSNGAFQLSRQTPEGVVLERAGNYWNAKAIALERVRFVPSRDAEEALAAYHAGEIDAVTNSNVEPLAVKLLAPYQDFRRSTFGALTYYQFNTASPPFDDLRVRQALTLAVDRERLSMDTLNGVTEAATRFLPAPAGNEEAEPHSAKSLPFDVERARQLLAEAGFPDGAGFPRVRLLVNRNEQHRQVAQAVASMWRRALGVETEIVMKDWEEYESALKAGDYDIARRSIVMQTTDEETNMLAMFAEEQPVPPAGPQPGDPNAVPVAPSAATAPPDPSSPDSMSNVPSLSPAPLIRTEAQALASLPAMPIYFASSFALVKPYVSGFDANLLDAPSLQHVRIDTGWQPPKRDTALRLSGGE